MAEITKEQVGWLCHQADGARHFVWFASDPDELSWLRKRYVRFDPLIVQQEGMVLVPREPTDSMLDAGNAARHPSADNVRNHGATTALRVWNAMLAASERDQRGSAKHEDTLQSMCGSGDSRPTEQGISQPSGTAPAEQTSSVPHHFRPSTLCESLYVLKARLSDHLSPAEQRDLDEAIEAISNSDLLRGIALGIEAAARYCNDENMPILAAILRSLNPADIAAKNPTAGKFPEHSHGEFDAERNRAHEQVGVEEARERVREKHPRAYSTRVGLKLWKIYDIDRLHVLGSGPDEDAAWLDAAGRLL